MEETDAMCKTKMSIAERLATEVAEPVKSERQNKSQQFKKVLQVWQSIVLYTKL